MLGATLSEIVIITVLLTLFPHSSVAVKVTVVEPVARHSSDKPVKSWLQLTSPQTSDAPAPPLDPARTDAGRHVLQDRERQCSAGALPALVRRRESHSSRTRRAALI